MDAPTQQRLAEIREQYIRYAGESTAANTVLWLLAQLAAAESREKRLQDSIPFASLTASNADAMAFHARKGKPNGGLELSALAEWLEVLAVNLKNYAALTK
jgi:hypothetical protein